MGNQLIPGVPAMDEGGNIGGVTPEYLRQQVNEAAAYYQLDSNLFMRQITQEGGLNPDVATGLRLSSAGAGGLGQFMPGTWSGVIAAHPELQAGGRAGLNATTSPGGRFNPRNAAYASAAHMRDLLDTFGNYRDALIAYNAGPGTVGQTNLPAETVTYLNNILGAGGADPEFYNEGTDSLSDGNGGGTSYSSSVSDIGPVNAAIQRDANTIERERIYTQTAIANTQNEIERNRIEGEQALTLRRDNEVARHNAMGETLDAMLVTLQARQQALDQELANLNASVATRGQDIDVRGQDIAALMQSLGLQNEQYGMGLQDTIARGQLGVEQRGQNVTMRGQDLSAQIAASDQRIQVYTAQLNDAIQRGDLQGRQDAELGLRAERQQNAALQQHALVLQGAELGLQGQQGSATAFGNLAGLEEQHNARLQNLAANPRDWLEYQYAVGGGQNFLEALAGGQPMQGQTFGNAQGGFLGAGFDQLVSQVTAQPAFTQAMQSAQNLGNFQAPAAPSQQQIQALGTPPPLQALPPAPQAPQIATPQLAPPPQVALPPRPTPPPMTYTPPPQTQPLSPAAGLSPAAQATFRQFTAAAPNVPVDVALGIAQRPADARRWMTAAAPPANPLAALQGWSAEDLAAARAYADANPMAEGGNVMITGPAVLMDIASGRPLATMGEPTKQFPQGIPELFEQTGQSQARVTPITKMAQGGTVTPYDQAFKAWQMGGPGPGTAPKPTMTQPSTYDQIKKASMIPSPSPTSPGYNSWKMGQAGPTAPGYDAWKQSTVPVGNAPGQVSQSPDIYQQAALNIQQKQLQNAMAQQPSQSSSAAEVAAHQAAAQSAVAWRASHPGSESPNAVALELYRQGQGMAPGAMYNSQTKQGMQLEWTPEGTLEWWNPHTGERRPYALGPQPTPQEAASNWTDSVRQSQMSGQPLLPQVKMAPMTSRPPGTEYGQSTASGNQPKNGAPVATTPGAPPPPVTGALTPAQLLNNIRQGLTPRNYSGLLPSQLQFLAGIISGLGADPEDFFSAQERSFPRGSQMAMSAGY